MRDQLIIFLSKVVIYQCFEIQYIQYLPVSYLTSEVLLYPQLILKNTLIVLPLQF